MSAQVVTGTRPSPSEPRPYRFPAFDQRTLDSGMRLLVAPVRKLPVATVIAVVDAGAACDPAGREGLARLTAQLLLEGTERSDGAELVERFERLGASVDASADWDSALVRVTTLSARLPESLELLGEVLRAPAFPVRELERLKAERLAELLQLRTEPRGLADEMLERVLYAEGSRYASPAGGSESSVAAVTRRDVSDFFERHYRPGALTIVIAGDTDADDAAALVSGTWGSPSAAVPQHVPVVDAPARTTRATHLVVKEDAAQSELRVGQVGLPRTHPDYFPATLMNAVLGGLFSSRINLNLREEHGYTYGAHSGFDWRRQRGPFVVSSAVRSDATADAAREVLAEIERIRREPVLPTELSLATSYLDGVFPIRYETTEAIAAALANLVVYGLPEDWYDTYRDRVRAVTIADVQRVAESALQPEALQLLVVGDPGVVRRELEGMGFGTLVVHERAGVGD